MAIDVPGGRDTTENAWPVCRVRSSRASRLSASTAADLAGTASAPTRHRYAVGADVRGVGRGTARLPKGAGPFLALLSKRY